MGSALLGYYNCNFIRCPGLSDHKYERTARQSAALLCTSTFLLDAKACLCGMTDRFKSVRLADVAYVSYHDTLRVNSSSNLHFSPDEHSRLDLCTQRELWRILRLADAFGSA